MDTDENRLNPEMTKKVIRSMKRNRKYQETSSENS